MTEAEWVEMTGQVADAMKRYTRSLVTPLSTSNGEGVWLVGSGSYVMIGGRRVLLTCEHASRDHPMEYRFFGSDAVFRHPGPFVCERDPVDAAFAPMTDEAWTAVEHQADTVAYERFAPMHHLANPAELLFFRGFAGENARYGFGEHQANASGYCSQATPVNSPDSRILEIHWEPQKMRFTEDTSDEARLAMKHEDPRGFSGSLVWNTRFVEILDTGRTWSPDCAVVTGLLHRYDPETKTLLALRVEHLCEWLDRKAKW